MAQYSTIGAIADIEADRGIYQCQRTNEKQKELVASLDNLLIALKLNKERRI